MINCFSSIIKEEGVLALWTGVGPTAGRATVLAAAELASYDEAKGVLSGFGMSGIVLVACTSFISGFISTVRDIAEIYARYGRVHLLQPTPLP